MSQAGLYEADVYSVEGLCSLEDEEFVHAAYRGILRRAPDLDGMQYYLQRVRDGVPKAQIVEELALSDEGRGLIPEATISGYRRQNVRSWTNWISGFRRARFESIERQLRITGNLNYRIEKALLRQERQLHDVLSLVLDVSAQVAQVSEAITAISATKSDGNAGPLLATSLAQVVGELQSAIISMRKA